MKIWTNGLLSKWGFADGDCLYDWQEACDFEPFVGRYHRALYELVKDFVIPQLDQKVEFYGIGTIHNPVRAATVDGFDVQDMHYNPNAPDLLSPLEIEIPDDAVAAYLRTFGGQEMPQSPENV